MHFIKNYSAQNFESGIITSYSKFCSVILNLNIFNRSHILDLQKWVQTVLAQGSSIQTLFPCFCDLFFLYIPHLPIKFYLLRILFFSTNNIGQFYIRVNFSPTEFFSHILISANFTTIKHICTIISVLPFNKCVSIKRILKLIL